MKEGTITFNIYRKSLSVFVILVGSLWHFVYEWSGRWIVIAAIAPVNESVWEHLKMGYWALLIYWLIGRLLWRDQFLHFGILLGGIAVLELVLLVLYYTYLIFFHHSILWDMSTYVFGTLACHQLINWLNEKNIHAKLQYISLAIFIAIGFLFAIFTFYPPTLPVFMDARNGTYGI